MLILSTHDVADNDFASRISPKTSIRDDTYTTINNYRSSARKITHDVNRLRQLTLPKPSGQRQHELQNNFLVRLCNAVVKKCLPPRARAIWHPHASLVLYRSE